MTQRPVRVRIAPSPTGDPHIGTAYMALFDYIIARKHGGQFVVRIEDTDQGRYRKDSEDQILDSLRWLGLTWDEGPDVGGPFGPYRQSERLPIYKQHVEELIAKGDAYRCFCTPERLDAVRKEQIAQKLSTIGYDRHCRSLTPEQVRENLAKGMPHTVRMRAPGEGKTSLRDGLRGLVEFDNATIDDQVLLKSDGFPTYHLAVVVDDHLMQITHVIRGEEWISSTPKHIILYEMFGWELPNFYHMNLLRNKDKSKISKRKNPTSITYYRRKGILPEALLNFLALMGWNPGNDQEIFSVPEMIEKFSWDRFTLGGPVFDLEKLTWLNGHYLRALPEERYIKHLREEIFSETNLRKILPLVRERIDKFEDFVTYCSFFFSGDITYDLALLVPKGRTAGETAGFLTDIMDRLEAIDAWTTPEIQKVMEGYNTEKGLKPKDTYMAARVAVSGRKESPPLFETMEALGKEIVRRRMRLAVEQLKAAPRQEGAASVATKK